MTITPSESYLNLSAIARIERVGYRAFIGGDDAETWYGIGTLQYQFLVSQGLQPHHVFIDIACGSLRLGQYLIPYLAPNTYFGLEAEPELVRRGLESELNFGLNEIKKPTFGFGYDFDFSFANAFDFAMAQSLFTHLTPDDIGLCFTNLRTKAHGGSSFFFTFFEGDSSNNPDISHANRNWHYNLDELSEIADATGWELEYIGDWKHPRDQKMVRARPFS